VATARDFDAAEAGLERLLGLGELQAAAEDGDVVGELFDLGDV
jgi:hypothetical protein